MSIIKENNRCEFVGQVIDLFEDFLDEKGIIISNPERDENPDVDAEDAANIFGTDYGYLQTELEEMFRKWKVLEPDPRSLKLYSFKVGLGGDNGILGWCNGTVTVQAASEQEAHDWVIKYISDGLCNSFPDLDIDFDIELVEE